MPSEARHDQELRLSEFLRDHQEEVLAGWERLVREQPVAAELAQPALRDHLPQLLDWIATFLDASEQPPDPTALEQLAELHALGRLDLGYDLGGLVVEYRLLRSCVTRLFSDHAGGVAPLDEIDRFNGSIDEAIRLSVARYATARGRTLIALDRFGQAALASYDAGILLPELLRVVVDTVDAVDMGAIFLLDNDVLHVAAAVGMLEEFPRLELAVGEGFAGLVAAARRPRELRDAGQSSLVKLRALPRDTKALYGVPLLERDRLVGVAYMGSRTATEFAPEDKILLHAMASRATSVIVQGRLRHDEQAERARADAEHRLLEAVLRELPVGVLVAEAPSGRVLMSNAAAEAVLGRAVTSVAPLSGGEDLFPSLHDGRRLPQDRSPLARALRSGERVHEDEIVVERQDGTHAVTVQSAAPVRDESGRVVAAVVALVDITERKEIERRLREAGEFRESFIGVLSHDLRNLVATISGTARVLLARESLDERASEMVSRIARTSERMTRMIRDLLDFTRGRLGGGIPVAPEATNIAEICRHVVDEFRAAYPASEFHVNTHGDLSGRWDPDRLAQALANLCKNAIDYGVPGAPIDVVASGDGDAVEVKVTNVGGPIPSDALETLFEPYRRASDRRRQTGLGLGLFIVREIARAHGGAIAARSTDGTVVFSMILPRDPSREA